MSYLIRKLDENHEEKQDQQAVRQEDIITSYIFVRESVITLAFKSKKKKERRETYISFAVTGKSKHQEAVSQTDFITSYIFVRENL